MGKEVDERVVAMTFDNKQFEANARSSILTLDKLKQSLNLPGAAKGLENIGSAAKNINLSSLGESVDAIRAKFSALDVIGVTAIANITNSAINAGKKMVSALTISPVISGFQEYETQINAVQTILANTSSKGTTLDQVNAALDELNHYADKTIYNFTEMTRNIGTFTAAGVDLKTSVDAIQGIANLAAVSGSNSQQASTAMYQLSQALASGTVKLMDWNSVVQAGMGGEVFRNALKETARLHGIAIDKMIEDEGSFNETLKNGWLSSDVLTETLKKFTTTGVNEYLSQYTNVSKDAIAEMRKQALASGDVNAGYQSMAENLAKSSKLSKDQIYQLLSMSTTAEDAATKVKTFTQLIGTLKEALQSGWTQTWEIVIGDFEQSKALFTELSDTFMVLISKSADARNNMLKDAMSSNWERLSAEIEKTGIANSDFQNALKETVKEHGIATDEMINNTKSFDDYLKNGWITSGVVTDTLDKMIKSSSGVSSATSDMTDKLKEFEGIVNKVINGDFGNGSDRMNALTKAGYDYVKVQETVNSVLKGGKVSIESLSDAQLVNVGYTKDQVESLRKLAKQAEETGTPINELIGNLQKPTGRELMLDSVRNILQSIIKSGKAVKDAWTDVFPPMTSQQLYNIIDAIHNFTEGLVLTDKGADELRRTLKGVFSILSIVTTISGGALRIGLFLLSKMFGLTNVNVLSLTATIGDAVVALKEFLFNNNVVIKGLQKGGDIAIESAKNAEKWIKAFVELPLVRTNITRFQQAFVKTFKDIKLYGNNGIDIIKSFIKNVKQMDSLTLDDVIKIIKDFGNDILKYILDIGGNFKYVRKAISDFRHDLGKNFKDAGKDVDGFKGKIISFLNLIADKFSSTGIGMGELLTIGVGAAMIIFVKKIGDALGKIAKPFIDFTGLIDEVGNTLKAYQKNLKADALLKIAIAIGILAASIALLTLLDQKKMWSAVGVLGALATGLLLVTAALSLIGKIGVAPSKGSLTLLAIAGSVLLLGIALKNMETLDGDKVLDNLKLLSTMAFGLATLAALLGRVAPELSKGALMPLFFVFSLTMLVNLLKKLDSTELGNLPRSMGILLGLVLGLVAVSAACKKVNVGAAFTILAISGSLNIMIIALQRIGDLDTSKIFENLKVLGLIFKMFVVLIVSTRLAGNNAHKAGIAILTMSVSLLIMVQALKMIAAMDPGDLVKSVATIVILLSVFKAIVVSSNYAGQHAIKAGVMLLLMAGTIVILTGAIFLLSHIKPDGLVRALGAIVVLGAVFRALIKSTEFAKDAKETLVLLSVTIGLLAVALGTLSMIDPKRLMSATAALSIVIGAFSLLVASTGLSKKATGTLVVMTLVVGALAGILALLSGLPVDSVLGVSKALSILLLSLSVSMVIIGAMKSVSPMSIITIGVMVVVVGLLAVIIGVLGSMKIDSVLDIAKSLSILLLSLSAACLILALVGTTGPAGLIGIGILMALIVGVGSLIMAIGALVEYFPNLETFLDTGIPILQKIGYAIGSFAGNMLGGLSDALPLIGENLSNFMIKAKPFFDGASGIDASTLSGVKAIAEMIILLTASELVHGLSSWLVGDSTLVDFGKQLAEFGPYFKMFYNSIQGIDGSSVEAAANAAKSLAVFATAIPNSGGMVSWFTGNNSLSNFAKELVLLGPSIKSYADSVSGIDVDAVSSSVNAAKIISDMAMNLPNSGGAVSWLTGDNTLSAFGTDLQTFGPKLKAYADSVSGLATDTITSSVNVITMLSDAASNLSGKKSGNITVFGDQLVLFGQSLSVYYTETSSINTGQMASVVLELDKLISLLSRTSGINFGNFNENLKKLGKASLEDFLNAFTGSTQRVIDTAVKTMNAFISGIQSREGAVKSEFMTMSSNASLAVNGYFSAFYSSGSYLAQGFANGIRDNAYLASNAASAMARSASTATNKTLEINSPSRVGYSSGSFYGIGFAGGIVDSGRRVYSASSNLANKAKDGLQNALSRALSMTSSDFNVEPTIKPVLDLSDIKSGMSSVNGLFADTYSMNLMSRAGRINSTMSQNQNGVDNGDVVSAINDLKDVIGNTSGATTNNIVNGVTYGDNSYVNSAIETLIGYIVKEGRR